MDSGTQAILISLQTAIDHSYPIHDSSKPLNILFGNSLTYISDTECVIDQHYIIANIVHNLSSNLIGIGPIVDNNYTVSFTSSNVVISNNNKHLNISNLVFPRSSDGLWRIPFSSLPPSSFINTSSCLQDDDTNYDDILLNYNLILNSCANINNTNMQNSYSARVNSTNSNNLTIINKTIHLHQRLGHAPSDAMCKAISGENPIWINSGLTSSDIHSVFNRYSCIACILCKRNHPGPQQKNARPIIKLKSNNISHTLSHAITDPERKKYQPGECISADMLPRINPTSINNDTTIFLFEDVATGYLWAIPGKDESSEAFIAALDIVLQFIQSYGYKMSIIRTDSADNLISKYVNQWISTKQVHSQQSSPYQHFQNEVERHVQTLLKGVSTLLHCREFLRFDLWNYALLFYVATRNATPNAKTNLSSPHFIFTKQIIDLRSTYLFGFGDIVLFNVEKHEKINKFDSKNQIGIYMSTSPKSKYTGMVYFPSEHKVLHRYTLAKINLSELTYYSWFRKRFDMHHKTFSPYQTIASAFFDFTAPVLKFAKELPSTTTAPITSTTTTENSTSSNIPLSTKLQTSEQGHDSHSLHYLDILHPDFQRHYMSSKNDGHKDVGVTPLDDTVETRVPEILADVFDDHVKKYNFSDDLSILHYQNRIPSNHLNTAVIGRNI